MHNSTEGYLTILYLFIFFCICICLYNGYETFIRYYDNKKKPGRIKLERSILLRECRKGHIHDRKKGKFRAKALLVFHEALLLMEQDYPNNKIVNRIATERMQQYIIKYKRKDILIKNYLVCLIGYHKTLSLEIANFLITCLDETSLTIKMEVLRSIAKLGNVNLLIRALDVLTESQTQMNDKIITDTLTDFNGDHKNLTNHLLQKLSEYSDLIKLAIITYLHHNNSKSVKSHMLRMLIDKKEDQEIILRILKYFGTVHEQEAEPILIGFALSDTWEYAAIAAKTLRNYPSEQTIAAAKKRLNDSNWYVRFNNAETLALICSRQGLKDVLESEDPYAREIMNYALTRIETVSERQGKHA